MKVVRRSAIAILAVAGVLAGAAGAIAVWPKPAVGFGPGAHTFMHIGCKHHAHGTAKWRDEQVRRLADRRRPAEPSVPAISDRAITAVRKSP